MSVNSTSCATAEGAGTDCAARAAGPSPTDGQGPAPAPALASPDTAADDLAHAIGQYYARSNAPDCNDVGYVAFRIYKRRQLHRMFARAVADGGGPADGRPLRLLDLGGGDGSDLDFVLRWAPPDLVRGSEVHLFDGDPDALRLARRRLAQLPVDGHVTAGSVTDPLPYPDRYFDVVICSEVVEHLEHPEHLLVEARRVIRPGGFLILTTDNEPTLQGRLKRAAKRLLGRHVPTEAERYRATGERTPLFVASVDGRGVPIYGHINVRRTTEWESACRAAGFVVHAFGTYESVRRHSTGASPLFLARLFLCGWLVARLPVGLGRHFGDTTALLLRRPPEPVPLGIPPAGG